MAAESRASDPQKRRVGADWAIEYACPKSAHPSRYRVIVTRETFFHFFPENRHSRFFSTMDRLRGDRLVT